MYIITNVGMSNIRWLNHYLSTTVIYSESDAVCQQGLSAHQSMAISYPEQQELKRYAAACISCMTIETQYGTSMEHSNKTYECHYHSNREEGCLL